jgi:hypothetical protein
VTAPVLTRRRALGILAVLSVAGLAGAWVVDRREDPSEQRREELAAEAWTLAPHEGVGAWVDVYDWTDEFTGGAPPVGLSDVDEMADAGVDTLYVQTAHDRSAAADVVEPERLRELIDRAHDRGLHVVAWYLPTLVDPEVDLRRLVASSELPVDGLGVDIESLDVPDALERNRRLRALTAGLRDAVGDDRVLAAITPSPTHLQVVNPDFWPAFPWPELAEDYDVLLPMSYWTLRDGQLGDPERHVSDDIDRIRTSTGDPAVPIHVIGGIADAIATADVEGMVRAASSRDVLGGSLYDWATSAEGQWAAMAPLRASG